MKQRKDENEKYTVLRASAAAAKELLESREVPQSEAQPTWITKLTKTILQAVPLSDAVRRVQDVSQSMKATLIEAMPKTVNLWSCAHKHGPWSFDPARQGNISCLYPKCELLCQLVGTKELEAEADNDDTKPLAADFTKPAANKYSPRQSNKPKPYEALMALPALPAEQVADLASQDRRRVFHVCEVRDGIHSINVKS